MSYPFKGMASNGPMTELDFAKSLTVDDLIMMMPEIEARFPKDKQCPNPADVHPATFAAILNVCTPAEPHEPSILGGILFDAIELHVRYDVTPWKMNPCTCGKMHISDVGIFDPDHPDMQEEVRNVEDSLRLE